MKRTFVLVVTLLALLFVAVGSVPAVITPPCGPNDPIDPVDGTGEGEDGDHPWGGDRVLGSSSGSPSTRTVTTSAVPGFMPIDLIFYYILDRFSLSGQTGGYVKEVMSKPTRLSVQYRLTREVEK